MWIGGKLNFKLLNKGLFRMAFPQYGTYITVTNVWVRGVCILISVDINFLFSYSPPYFD